MDLARFKHTSSPSGKQEALRRCSDLVKPINKAEALRKSYYDPRTIARDILIASGRHPTGISSNYARSSTLWITAPIWEHSAGISLILVALHVLKLRKCL
jgi:hypothetical protein